MDTFSPLVTTRSAQPEEYARVVELTHEMYNAIDLDVDTFTQDSDWEKGAAQWLAESMDNGTAQAAVAHDSATNSIVACGIGIIYNDIPQPWLPNGKMGYIRWMSTAEDFRGYGIGEKVLNFLMNWFSEQGVSRVQLHASDKAIEFYKQHGFEETSYTNMWWRKA
jgi:ribosomal protein S18 acetylase RimI-like enzyme